MSYQKDPWYVAVWGRLGASVLALTAFALGIRGYTVGPEEIATVETLITSLLAGVAGVLAIISKVRESKKAAQ